MTTKEPNETGRRLLKATVQSGRTLSTVIGYILKAIATVVLILITTGAIMSVIFTVFITRYLTVDMDFSLEEYTLDLSSFVYYIDKKTGQQVEMETLHGSQNRIMASYEEMPQDMIDAVVAIEDKRFWEHDGVDWKRTSGAFVNMFLGMKDNFGGSTLTQQLIKNLTDEKEVTVQRKIQEILRALEFEKYYTKQEILELYLNTIYLSRGAYGVKAAALTYFDKELYELTLAECASLAGITNSPTMYDPFLNPENNKERQEIILKEMYDQGYIDEKECEAAKREKLQFKRRYETADENIRSFFVDAVYQDVIEDLIREKGISRQVATQFLLGGGYSVVATIDMDIQGIVDDVFGDDENFPVVKDSEKPQCSMMIIDPYTGDVVAMAGRRGEKEGNLVRNLATQAQRQPGSSIKPIAVYAPAMDLGLITPYTIIEDAPIMLNGKSWPRNSNGRYSGRITITQAVTSSINTVAVKVMERLTPDRSYEFMTTRLGVSSLVARQVVNTKDGEKIYSDINLSLALGGVTRGLTVQEMTAAYTIFTNRGIYTRPRTYSVVYDSHGNVVLDNRPVRIQAIKEKTAFYMNQMLQNVVRSGTGRGAALDNMATAGKTGTTSEDKDRWFAGYTPYYTGVVWFGFEYPKKIKLSQSTNPAQTMWKLVMERVHENLEPRDFFTPGGSAEDPVGNTITAAYCIDSGMQPTDNCRQDVRGSRAATGQFFPEDAPKSPCTLHTMVEICTFSRHKVGPYCPPEMVTRISFAGDAQGEEDDYHPNEICPSHNEFWYAEQQGLPHPETDVTPPPPENGTDVVPTPTPTLPDPEPEPEPTPTPTPPVTEE